MPSCKQCGEEVDEFVLVRVDGRSKKMCADCAELVEEESAVARESEAVVQNMMGYKGRR